MAHRNVERGDARKRTRGHPVGRRGPRPGERAQHPGEGSKNTGRRTRYRVLLNDGTPDENVALGLAEEMVTPANGHDGQRAGKVPDRRLRYWLGRMVAMGRVRAPVWVAWKRERS